jgi:DNA-binding MarR family transcriptional regulator
MSKDISPDLTTQAILERWSELAPNDRLAHLVRDVARGLTRCLQLRLSEHAISFGHWVFLRLLWEQDGISQRDLSVQAGLTEPTTHTALQRMEELGFISRRHLQGNRKRLHIFLTAKGHKLKDKLVPLAEEVNTVAVTGVSDRNVEITRRTLVAMLQNLAADELQAVDRGQRISATRELGQAQRKRSRK